MSQIFLVLSINRSDNDTNLGLTLKLMIHFLNTQFGVRTSTVKIFLSTIRSTYIKNENSLPERACHDSKTLIKQDGPSLESSSYLNVSLRYLGPWDFGTPGPWNAWTLGLLDLFTPPTLPHTSPYILFLLLSSFCMVWLRGG